MTTVNSYKPLEQAIKNGEKTIKVETPKFLVACAVAEKCEGISNHIKSYLDLMFSHQKRDVMDYSKLYFPLISEKGKTYRIRLTISLCADALKVMDILKHNDAELQMVLNDEGAMTGEVKILRVGS